jgi:glycosyltransferase 2 family protein
LVTFTLLTLQNMVRKWLKSTLQFVIFTSLGILLIWYSVRSFSAEEIRKVQELIWNVDAFTVISCILILLLSHFVRALRWRMMIEPLGKSPKVSNVFYAVLNGFFFNLLFPRLGEVMKCSLLGKYEKIAVDKLLGTMFAERVIDLCCLIMVILLTIFTQIQFVGDYSRELWNSFSLKLQSSSNFILIIGIVLVIIVYIFYKLLKNKNLRWVIKIKSLVKGLFEGLLSIRKISSPSLFILYTIAIWFLYLASIKVGFHAMQSLSTLGWVPSLTILTFGSFAMIATQGGIGAYQLAVQKTLGLYGINELAGLAFGWLLWSVQTILMLVTGPISLLLLYLRNKKD